MVRIADIAKQALNAVDSAIEGVVQDANVVVTAQGEYDETTAQYAKGAETRHPCRIVEGDIGRLTRGSDEYIAEPNDKAVLVEGLSTIVPKGNMEIEFAGNTYTIKYVSSIAGTNEVYDMVIR